MLHLSGTKAGKSKAKTAVFTSEVRLLPVRTQVHFLPNVVVISTVTESGSWQVSEEGIDFKRCCSLGVFICHWSICR